jgi:hypothetical protein
MFWRYIAPMFYPIFVSQFAKSKSRNTLDGGTTNYKVICNYLCMFNLMSVHNLFSDDVSFYQVQNLIET